jgi:hypothetical protein
MSEMTRLEGMKMLDAACSGKGCAQRCPWINGPVALATEVDESTNQ